MNNQYQIIETALLLHDFDEQYFKHAFDMLLIKLDHFNNLKRAPTIQEQKELRFMLDALIEAKINLNN